MQRELSPSSRYLFSFFSFSVSYPISVSCLISLPLNLCLLLLRGNILHDGTFSLFTTQTSRSCYDDTFLSCTK
ncbi:hypothetical protein MtrunA17_Chr6g0450111 [Medicago truncatula]|uniref:Transmembrane protein n=1 Tax=Medicago truncatula TaxID=3880 RepID=A0A396HAQ2_MEDTR|nr:hypothetical protein MtrunA17_Chr6g0450111 [Medicago truncatula]